jgi:penicillin amidase
MLRRIGGLLALSLAPLVVAAAAFAAYVFAGVVAGGAEPAGALAGLGVRQDVAILRDARGIPHVRARDEHDLFFAEGYLEGSDRLFQLDLYRRLVEGRLSEILGNLTLKSDEDARVYDIAAIASAQLAALPPAERANLDAYAAGVNAAMRTRPLPPECRILAYQPEAWTPRDSLATSFATVLALTDSWDDVAMRSDVLAALGPSARDAFFPITDPAYDRPATGGPSAPVAPLPPLEVRYPDAEPLYVAGADAGDLRAGLGSNEFAAGAHATATHRALLANDPHLELRIPGVWWLVDLEGPGYHAAGATLAGVPGVVLGHNAHLAWGATNGTVVSVRVFRERFRSADSDLYAAGGGWLHAQHRLETFKVRFGRPVERDYLRTRHGFVFRDGGTVRLAAAWTADLDRRSAFEQFDGLARADGVPQAMTALSRYPGPPQNFALADDRGNAGYVLAGDIPLDDVWGLRVLDGATAPAATAPNVPFAKLPQTAPGPGVVVVTANNRVYGAGYPYRLSAIFSPPYRAAELWRDLAKRPYGVATFSAAQADVTSLPERELALAALAAAARKGANDDDGLRAELQALRGWDGRFTGDSRAAVYAVALRRVASERLVRYHLPKELGLRYLSAEGGGAFVAVLRMLRERPRGWVPKDDYDAFLVAALRDASATLERHQLTGATWSDVGARIALHPLAGFGLAAWDGVRFPGLGDAYSPHVQAPANAQSFRAVWDVGRWENGGMVIPQGESGEPGSPHYRDLAATWLGGELVPLPFDDAAVESAAASRLELKP